MTTDFAQQTLQALLICFFLLDARRAAVRRAGRTGFDLAGLLRWRAAPEPVAIPVTERWNRDERNSVAR